MKILVIDDDAMTRKSLQHILSQEGHVVKTAKDGSDAGKQLADHLPDLIFCDLMMPHVSGVAFIHVLRDHLHYNIPVIVISSLDKGNFITENLGLTRIDFMAKPIHADDLIRKVNEYANFDSR